MVINNRGSAVRAAKRSPQVCTGAIGTRPTLGQQLANWSVGLSVGAKIAAAPDAWGPDWLVPPWNIASLPEIHIALESPTTWSGDGAILLFY